MRRRLLVRELGGSSTLLFVMLNPSTADATRDDPTIRRCIGFARSWGYGRLEVVNLFSHRATRPRDLDRRVVAWDNRAIREAVARANAVVAAWGVHGAGSRAQQVARLLGPEVLCLGTTAAGHPRHPLYVRADTMPEAWVTGG